MASELVPYKEMESMAAEVVRSKLFPGIQTTSQALTLFLVAQAEGLHPMTAAMRYNVIQNRPALKADAMLASFMERGGTVKWVEWTNDACEAIFKSAGVPEGVKVRWTMDDAIKAGVTGNPTWKKYPRQMLKARVASDGVRMADPAVNYGRYTPEEVADFDQPKVEQIEHEVVGEGEEVAKPVGANAIPIDSPSPPPRIESASEPGTTEEHLAAAKKRREEALERFANLGAEPEEPIQEKLAKISAEAAKKFGRPKGVPEFCPACQTPISKQEATSDGGEYWECNQRYDQRHQMAEARQLDGSPTYTKEEIREFVKGHFFKWAGGK